MEDFPFYNQIIFFPAEIKLNVVLTYFLNQMCFEKKSVSKREKCIFDDGLCAY